MSSVTLAGEVIFDSNQPHHILGSIVIMLSLIEVGLGFFSNCMWKEGKPPHIVHDKLHWYVGRLTWVLAIANIIVGFYAYMSLRVLATTLFGLGLFMYAVAILYLELTIGQGHEHLMSDGPDSEKSADTKSDWIKDFRRGRNIIFVGVIFMVSVLVTVTVSDKKR
jgi:hypothetical protein